VIKERDLLEKVISGDNKGDFFVSYDLYKEIYEFLAQPEEGVYQKLLRIEKENYVEMLPSELWLDGYEAGKRSALLSKQPEEEPKFNFDLERMKAAIESPISDVTVDDLAKQVKQEPVAWKVIDGTNGEYMFSRVKPMERSYKYDVVIPLYTAPPKREPLSKEQYMKFFTDTYDSVNPITDFVRAIEKAHGIGGGE
jgi:hypothetical protein